MKQIFSGRCNIICIMILEIFGMPQMFRCTKKCYSPTYVSPLDILYNNTRSVSSISTLTSKTRKSWSASKSSSVDAGVSLDTAQKINQSKTFTRKLKSISALSDTEIQCKRMRLLKNNPSIATNFGTGGLGNQMCNFASLYAIHKEFGVQMYLRSHSYELLQDAFDLPNPMSNNLSYSIWNFACVDPGEVEWAYISNMQMLTDTDRTFIFEQVKLSHYIYVSYIFDIKGFIPYLKEIRNKFFRFKEDDMKHSKTILRKIKKTNQKTTLDFVSIHIRLQDMVDHLANANSSLPSPTYFKDAMKYFERTYGINIVFAVFSDDIVSASSFLYKATYPRKFNILFPSFRGDSSITPIITLAL